MECKYMFPFFIPLVLIDSASFEIIIRTFDNCSISKKLIQIQRKYKIHDFPSQLYNTVKLAVYGVH